MRQLGSFNICRSTLRMFWESAVASAILYAVVCQGSRLRLAYTDRLNRLIRKASDVIGVKLDPLTVVSERRFFSYVKAILDKESKPLNDVLVQNRSSCSGTLNAPQSTTRHHSCLCRSNSITPHFQCLTLSGNSNPGIFCAIICSIYLYYRSALYSCENSHYTYTHLKFCTYIFASL